VEASQVSEPRGEVTRDGSFLDDNVQLIQNDDRCWAMDMKIGRVWAFIHTRHEGVYPRVGWFWLKQSIENRVLNKELLAAGAIELGEKIKLADGSTAQEARLISG